MLAVLALSLTASAGRLTPQEMGYTSALVADLGRDLYIEADRAAEHTAACLDDPRYDAATFRGYLDTYIAAAWTQKGLVNAIVCQREVLALLQCEAKLPCEEHRASAADDDVRTCGDERDRIQEVCR